MTNLCSNNLINPNWAKHGYIQVYTGNWLNGCPKGRGGAEYHDYYGVALECQHLPDSPNHADFPSTVLRPGEEFNEMIIFKFYTR